MTMTKNKGLFAGLIVGTLALLLWFGYALTAQANPLRFPPMVASATATTTVNFLTAAAATTTLVTYDSYANTGVSGAGGSTQALDKATLLVQFAASSTSAVLNLSVEHSMNGIDWFQDNVYSQTATGYVTITTPTIYAWTALSTATTSRAIGIAAPLRYVRVVAQVQGAAGAVWAAIQPQKQGN